MGNFASGSLFNTPLYFKEQHLLLVLNLYYGKCELAPQILQLDQNHDNFIQLFQKYSKYKIKLLKLQFFESDPKNTKLYKKQCI